MAKKWIGEDKEKAFNVIIQRICDGESLRSILQYANRDILPSYVTFLEWVEQDESLSKQYARAMNIRSDRIFDEILEISDESNADIDISDDGKVRINGEAVQRSRLRVDARKWALSKMQPKKYGDRLDMQHSGPNGGPIQSSVEHKVIFEDYSEGDGNDKAEQEI